MGDFLDILFLSVMIEVKNIFAKEEALFYLNSYLCRMMQK
jgi:hypothetical protein